MPNEIAGVKGDERPSNAYIYHMKRLILMALLFPFCAAAQEAERPEPKTMAELYPHMQGVEYFCTNADGDRVDIGGVVCITAGCITWMARCEMAANNNMAMWRKMQDGCPGVSLSNRLARLLGET